MQNTHEKPDLQKTKVDTMKKTRKVCVDRNKKLRTGKGCLCKFCTKQGAWSLYISIKNHDMQTEKGKFIYKALTLPSKQLLLKCDQFQSHKSAI